MRSTAYASFLLYPTSDNKKFKAKGPPKQALFNTMNFCLAMGYVNKKEIEDWLNGR